MASVYPQAGRSAWILNLRGARSTVVPDRPHGFFLEEERSSSGAIVTSAGILLTNKECPWHCLMCDLWKNTLTESLPPGLIPRQIDYALEQLGRHAPQVKLYNSGSFFDPAAIPVVDYEAIAQRVAFADNVVVESHPKLIGDRTLRFRDLVAGRLEVALGLEIARADALEKLNKGFDLKDYEEASQRLRRAGISVRAFILVKPPFIQDDEEAIAMAAESARFAFQHGAQVVSLIPTRAGNGAIERLIQAREYVPPRLDTLERAQETALSNALGRVFADTWDLERFSHCAACFSARKQRIHAMNLSQSVLPRVRCKVCD